MFFGTVLDSNFNMKHITYIALLFSTLIFAQEDPVEQDSTVVHYMIIEGDSIPVTEVELDEVLMLPNLSFKDRNARIRYIILR